MCKDKELPEAEEIEVTPEMVKAGTDILAAYNRDLDEDGEVVRAILFAALQAGR